jgi:hypothetical protein
MGLQTEVAVASGLAFAQSFSAPPGRGGLAAWPVAAFKGHAKAVAQAGGGEPRALAPISPHDLLSGPFREARDSVAASTRQQDELEVLTHFYNGWGLSLTAPPDRHCFTREAAEVRTGSPGDEV